MGSITGLPGERGEDSPDDESDLGEFVAGRLAEVSIDSVAEVRDLRESE